MTTDAVTSNGDSHNGAVGLLSTLSAPAQAGIEGQQHLWKGSAEIVLHAPGKPTPHSVIFVDDIIRP